MIAIKRQSKVYKSIFLTLLFFIFAPNIVQATTIDTDIEGYSNMLNVLRIYVRGAGGLVLMFGAGDFFISLANESIDRLVRAMQIMGAGCFLILADGFVQAIAKANGGEAFQILFAMVSLIVSFIGAVLSALGGYKVFNSFKDRNPEARNKAIKVLFSGLTLIAISQSVSNFII